MIKSVLSLIAGIFFVMLATSCSAQPTSKPSRIVALGDSLTAGYGLAKGQDFASKLQNALRSEGYNVTVDNGGVSGDTTAGGLLRVDRLINVTPKPDLVIVELGANDMLRGVNPQIMEANLRQILRKIQEKEIPALLTGMLAPYQFPPVYRNAFNNVFPQLAREFNVPLYEFFLEGVALDVRYNLPDRAHPNAAGIDIIVRNILPSVRDALAK